MLDKEETFESYYKSAKTYNLSALERQILNKLKQLHDKSIKEYKIDHLRCCLEKDKQISDFVTGIQRRDELIKELQAENEKLKNMAKNNICIHCHEKLDLCLCHEIKRK